MNSRFRNAVVFALLLPFATMAVAEARPGGSSFRGGFSSHKSSVTRSAPAPAPKQPSFGSFGSRRPDAAPARPSSPASAPDAARGGSAMSRDLDRSAAQDRAVRNWESRRDASSASNTPPLPPLNPVLPGGASSARSASAGAADTRVAGNGATSGGYSQPGPAPVVIRERSGSNAWLWGIGGYLLGSHAMSHAKDAPPAPNTDANPAGAASSAAGGTAQPAETGTGADAAPKSDLDALTASASRAAETAAAGSVQATEPSRTPAVEAQKERSAVRTMTWALLIFGFAWLLWIGWRHAKAGKKNANYSFERN
ncbi:hypothetical protein ACHMW6_34855 [Pseudoduganella sp. UC29_106]|uniref:hypothetical protein n=1 Tax=Pseudoduganella sp. UC29_106 TaxID=3374553 RepID=UPI00375696E3